MPAAPGDGAAAVATAGAARDMKQSARTPSTCFSRRPATAGTGLGAALDWIPVGSGVGADDRLAKGTSYRLLTTVLEARTRQGSTRRRRPIVGAAENARRH